MHFTPEHRAKAAKAAADKRATNKAERETQTIHLPGGAKVYPDSPPGVGFVLEFPPRRKPSHGAPLPLNRKCYYGTSKQAVHFWTHTWADDFGQKDEAGNLIPAEGALSQPALAA
jgi:hypothetical protein